MKQIHLFQTHIEEESFEGSNNYSEPYVSLCVDNHCVHYNKVTE